MNTTMKPVSFAKAPAASSLVQGLGDPVELASKNIRPFSEPLVIKTDAIFALDPIPEGEGNVRFGVGEALSGYLSGFEGGFDAVADDKTLKRFVADGVATFKVTPDTSFFTREKTFVERKDVPGVVGEDTAVKAVLKAVGVSYGLTTYGVLWTVEQVIESPQPKRQPTPPLPPPPSPPPCYFEDNSEDEEEKDFP